MLDRETTDRLEAFLRGVAYHRKKVFRFMLPASLEGREGPPREGVMASRGSKVFFACEDPVETIRCLRWRGEDYGEFEVTHAESGVSLSVETPDGVLRIRGLESETEADKLRERLDIGASAQGADDTEAPGDDP